MSGSCRPATTASRKRTPGTAWRCLQCLPWCADPHCRRDCSVRKKLTQAFALLRAYQTKVSQLSISTDKDLPSSAQGLHVPSAAHSRSHQPQQHRHQQQEQPQPSWQHVSHTADAHLHQADVGRHVCQRARQPEQQQHWTSMPLSHQPHPATSPLDLIEATVAALSSGSSCSSLKHVPPQRLHQPAAAASVPSPGHMHSWPNLCHLGSSVSPSSSCHEHLGQHSMQWCVPQCRCLSSISLSGSLFTWSVC